MLIQTIVNNLIWSQGLYIILGGILFGILGHRIHPIFSWVAAGFLIFSFYFFRNPERFCPEALADPRVLVSPADGHVVDIDIIQDEQLGSVRKVSIFLSPLDVHVNWTPIAGTIDGIIYRPGKFIVAYAPKSSDINERNDIIIITNDHKKILVRQIAGFVARRICCWVHAGDMLPVGTKYGMIRFGSRVDLLLPLDTTLSIVKDQYVYGGQTVLGKLS